MQASRSPEEWLFLQRVAERRKAKGKPPPKALASMPELSEWEQWHLAMFTDLASTRGCGFSPEPIRVTDFESWCRVHRVADWRRPMLWRIVRRLDAVSLQEASKRDHAPPGD